MMMMYVAEWLGWWLRRKEVEEVKFIPAAFPLVEMLSTFLFYDASTYNGLAEMFMAAHTAYTYIVLTDK